jgi:hypothetical protein
VLLVIFGAGASFDSVHAYQPNSILPAVRTHAVVPSYENDRPPLANQLFDNRPEFVRAMARFPACLPLIPTLQKPGVIVERELARIRGQAEHYPPAHKELASILYYLHFAIWECQSRWRGRHSGITNYAALLRELDRWRLSSNKKVCLVTFNYDTMLDEELKRLNGREMRNMSDYAQENYTLIKLHGSINWGREVDGLVAPIGSYSVNALIDAAGQLQISNRYRVVEQYPMVQIPNEPRIVFPALSIPVANKDEFSCPEAHVQLLLKYCRRSQRSLRSDGVPRSWTS